MDKLIKDLNNGKSIAVIGSRSFNDKKIVFEKLDKNINDIALIVSGGARGADSIAREWAIARAVPILEFHPQWKDENNVLDRGAGFRRNAKIIKNCDVVFAFWDEESKGTANSVSQALIFKKPVYVYNFKTRESKRIF